MPLSMKNLIWLLAGCTMYAAEADRAITPIMKRAGPNVNHVRVLHRIQIETDLDLVIAIGTPWDSPMGTVDGDLWSDKTAIGLFLQQRDKPELVYQITVAKGSSEGDCYARLERATATDVVISCAAEKSKAGPNRKFVYDIRAKALVKQIDYAPFSMSRLFVTGDKAVLVGSDSRRLVVVEYSPEKATAFRVLRSSEAERWTARVRTTALTSFSGVTQRNDIYMEPETFKAVRFGLNDRFTLAQNDNKGLVVMEGNAQHVKNYELPQPGYEEFKLARPGRVKDGYTRAAAKIGGAIGPWQIADGTVWFGKSFYDGEGSTGVGGFGYFDCEEAKYRIYSPAEMADLSVTAILVESDAVWLGLASHGEWGSTGGQVVRFDRATEKVQKIELRGMTSRIARVGGQLLLATEFGIAVVAEGKARRFFVDQTSDGRLRVVETFQGK